MNVDPVPTMGKTTPRTTQWQEVREIHRSPRRWHVLNGLVTQLGRSHLLLVQCGWRSTCKRKPETRKRVEVMEDEKSEIFIVLRKRSNVRGGKGDRI